MNMTPAEQAVLTQIEADRAAGRDAFGDLDDDSTGAGAATADQAALDAQAAAAADAAAAQAQADADNAAKADGQGQAADAEKPADDAGSAVDVAMLEEIANPGKADPLNLLNFAAEVPQDYKAQRTALMTEKAEAMAQMMEGTIDAKEYAAIDARVADALEDLTAARIRAETLQEASAQSHAQYQQLQITQIAQQAKKAGEVDYATDRTAQMQFDIALQGIKADPANAAKDYASLVQDAHAAVLAMRGIAKKAAPAATAPPADRKPTEQAPVTLRNLPAAAQSNTGGSITDQMATLKGQEFEAAFARLTPQQRAAMLDE